MVDVETGESVSTDEMRYGLRVAVLALPASPMLTSETALKVRRISLDVNRSGCILFERNVLLHHVIT